jgi:hypothetical protein
VLRRPKAVLDDFRNLLMLSCANAPKRRDVRGRETDGCKRVDRTLEASSVLTNAIYNVCLNLMALKGHLHLHRETFALPRVEPFGKGR